MMTEEEKRLTPAEKAILRDNQNSAEIRVLHEKYDGMDAEVSNLARRVAAVERQAGVNIAHDTTINQGENE